MTIAVQLEPPDGAAAAVEYRWDTDTDILTARIEAAHRSSGVSGFVELEGADGSWLILDVAHGRLSGIEVAVWPDVRKSPSLVPPQKVEDANILIPLSDEPGHAMLEAVTPLGAEADAAERVIYFRIGVRREARTIRLGRDLLLDLDPAGRIAGLWLLNVPPFPITTPP